MPFSYPQIAADHNNEEDLTRWSKLQVTPCKLFQGYKKFIPAEWHCSEGQELGADRRYKKTGKPWQALIFPLITPDEHALILSMFTTNNIDGYVTIVAYDFDYLTWKTFNATLISLPENRNFDIESGFYKGYRLEFRDMKEI